MGTKEAIVAFTWEGEQVLLDPYHRFHVPSLETAYESAREAKDAIDRKKAQLARVEKKKLSLAVVDSVGTPHTITGIHAGHGRKILSPKLSDRYLENDLFPTVDWIVAAIKKERSLRAEAQRIRDAIGRFELASDTYGSGGCDLAARYAEVESDYAKKLAAANKTTLEKELASASA